MRRSLEALEGHLPGMGGSLAQLRIRCEGDRVLVDETSCSFEASTGQLVLDFEVAALRTEAARVLMLPWVDGDDGEDTNPPSSAYEWFLHAGELERQWDGAPADVAGFEAARRAYERALELDPDLAAAWTNLGSMLAERGELDEAREHYERALECDSDQPEAQCNMAELLLREGEPEASISAYRTLLRSAPDWFEAHYGLARALLMVGGKGQALAHLERFCHAVDTLPRSERTEELEERRDHAKVVIGDLRRDLAR